MPDDVRPTGPRGRVVILVDNDVRRDSRVQKQASSMAAAGWDVRVLGLAPRGETARWEIGTAKVRLLRVKVNPRTYEDRNPRFRDPCAWSSTEQKQRKSRRLERRRADRQVRWMRSRSRARTRLGRKVATARYLPGRIRDDYLARWYRFRSLRTTQVKKQRKAMLAPRDRLATWFLTRVRGARAWRQLDSQLWDFDTAYGKAIDRIKPDLIHANDFRMLGVGARAKMRAAARGRQVGLVWDAHEFLPGTKPWNNHPRWHVAQMAHEREYARYADEVVTVSHELAELLRKEHRLKELPTVVLNCPTLPEGVDSGAAPSVRERCGVAPETPILVYSGSPSLQRGLLTVVEALPHLDEAVLAMVVSVPESAPVQRVVERATELGVVDRVRLLPYVPPEQVVDYLSSADVGLIPIQHFPNHEIALITKFFEYTHARLPIVVSDVRAMSAQVRATRQGEVFVADDVDDLVRAVKTVLKDPGQYGAIFNDEAQLKAWTWEAQAEILDATYRRVLKHLRS